MLNRLGPNPHGTLVPTMDNQKAFVPAALPKELRLSPHLVWVLDKASRAVASLAALGEYIPNPHLLIPPMVRREALSSSRIEGTVASLSDVLSHEATRRKPPSDDVQEVINYVKALELGIELLEELPISYLLVNQVHGRLLSGVRGREKHPGEFRREQVWIGAPRSSIRNARFIPPPPDRLRDLFYDWERFANESLEMPPLMQCGLMHYQIEAIHPYEDGNGRIGRLLITLFLKKSGILPTPLLYLSAYFERDRQRYYDELFNVSVTGDWERWLEYFLTGVYQESLDVVARIRRLRDMQEGYRAELLGRRAPASESLLVDELFANPFMTVRRASEILDMTPPGARRALGRLADAGIVRIRPNQRPQLYVAEEVLEILDADEL